MSLTISGMQLIPHVAKAAQLILDAHPYAHFTSGRRDAGGQARVMAANVCKYGPAWLQDTYSKKHARLVSLLMTYVEENPGCRDNPEALSGAFYHQMLEHYSRDLKQFPHLVGRAFDIAWPRKENQTIDKERGEAICKTILELPTEYYLELLLKKEGALDVIHAQFNPITEI